MKKKITILMLALMIILTSTLTLTVNAADATVALSTVEAQQPGDTFTITFSAECTTELEGIDSNLIYDKDKLEFIEADKANSNWNVMDTDISDVPNSNYDRNIAVYCNQAKTSDDIFVMTFKVKETAPVNTTAEISLNGIVLYDSNNQSYDIETKTIQVSIAQEPSNPGEDDGQNPSDNPNDNPNDNPSDTPNDNPNDVPSDTQQDKTLTAIEITKAPTKNTYKVGDKFDKTGMKVVAKYSDGTSKEITNYTVANGDKLTEGQTSVKISYTEGNVTKTVEQKITVVKNITVEDDKKDDNKSDFEDIKEDNTKTENKMPDTGISSIVGIIIIVAVFGVVCLVKYNKYREI